jgi:formylmethanofuran--tetrahydromethanopterin N-formyltransferase
MEINGVPVEDTYAEAFPTWIARIIITAVTGEWAVRAATEATGFATSATDATVAGPSQHLPR